MKDEIIDKEIVICLDKSTVEVELNKAIDTLTELYFKNRLKKQKDVKGNVCELVVAY